MRSKSGEFDFSWLFAIIVGAMILVLAIYGVVRLSDTQRYQADTETAKKIEILTNPLQAGFAEGKFGTIEFRQTTRINNLCSSEKFGENKISVSTQSSIGDEWKMAGGEISVHNKYIFSSENQEGDNFYVLSKPFYFPFKVSDLTIMTSDKENYCFVDAPEIIEEDVLGLNIPNVFVENCSSAVDYVRVCFGAFGNCDIVVRGSCSSNCGEWDFYDTGIVEKNGATMSYIGNLLFGAIFSDENVYECNVKRLMYRASQIAEGFAERTDLMTARGCNTNLKADMVYLQGLTGNASSSNLVGIYQVAKQTELKNEQELCGLW